MEVRIGQRYAFPVPALIPVLVPAPFRTNHLSTMSHCLHRPTQDIYFIQHRFDWKKNEKVVKITHNLESHKNQVERQSIKGLDNEWWCHRVLPLILIYPSSRLPSLIRAAFKDREVISGNMTTTAIQLVVCNKVTRLISRRQSLASRCMLFASVFMVSPYIISYVQYLLSS
jgi:hypothetical protein